MKRKIPPFEKVRIEQKGRLWEITFDEDPELRDAQVLKTHQFRFSLPDDMITELDFWESWLPYERGEIMRYGHQIDPRIPEEEDEAEFPPEPLGMDVEIRIKLNEVIFPPAPVQIQPQPLGWRGAPWVKHLLSVKAQPI